jgi:hypothetical protein
MKNLLLLFLFSLLVFGANGQFLIRKVVKNHKENLQKQDSTCPPLDSAVYKTCLFVKYDGLPGKIKMLMDSLGCGRIDAAPDQTNDLKTNTDFGYSIDLNDDKIPEYVFCCNQETHGRCNANIFTQENGSWKLVMSGISGVSAEDPTVNIKVLRTVHEGFHDLYQKEQLLIFKNGFYRQE